MFFSIVAVKSKFSRKELKYFSFRNYPRSYLRPLLKRASTKEAKELRIFLGMVDNSKNLFQTTQTFVNHYMG